MASCQSASAVGPFGLGRLAARQPFLTDVTIAEATTIAPIERLGGALLLFMIGLELSFERPGLMRRLAFWLGALPWRAIYSLQFWIGLDTAPHYG